MNKTLAFLACLAIAMPAFAQQYKWVDKNGKVQYGDAPPPGVKATALRPPPGPAPTTNTPSAAGKKDKPLSPEEAFKKRQEEAKEKQEKASKEQADASAKKENCERARINVRTYAAGGRITRIDSKGERIYLDDAQIASELAKAQAAEREACSG